MRRYHGSDKPPGPTLSPPPYSRRTSAGTKPRTVGSRQPTTGKTSPVSEYAISERDMLMIQGSGSASVYLDPRTKMPVIPPAGRSIPKLKMADLTSSLTPLVDSQIIPEPERPSLGDKRRGSLKVGPAKDMLSSFDDAIRVPDMRMINSKVAQLRNATYMGRDALANITSKGSGIGSGTHKSKSSGKVEEQNMRKLMGQLRDKYLEDMESQLGLAVERKPRSSFSPSLKNAQYGEMRENDEIEVEIPRPTTNATEISSRIDKVVREWAAESQKLNKQDQSNNLKSRQQKSNAMALINKSPPESQRTSKAASKRNNDDKAMSSQTCEDLPPAAPNEVKNKNLAKISNAFRKSLDPITKQDVRELIKVPENDLDDLVDEHEQRRKAHEAVFKNAITAAPSPAGNDPVKKSEHKNSPGKTKHSSRDEKNPKPHSTLDEEKRNRNQPAPVNRKLKPFAEALGLAKGDDNEMYSIIKEHMAYEMASGPPKLTAPSVTRKRSTTSSTNMLRADAAGKVLQKYGESHKKLQGIVDSFTLKVDSSRKRLGPGATSDTSDTSAEEGEQETKKVPTILPVSTLTSKSTLNARRQNATAVNSTISKSIKSIDKASTVAQRLGTLMSRVALRNEKYDYEKQQEVEHKSISVGPDVTPSTPEKSIRQQSHPSILREAELAPNPYETSTPSRRPSIPLGVSKIESAQFDKYVEEMRKVAEKAAQSFDKFKELKHGDISFSENEETSEGESDEEAFATAAAVAEIAARQEEKRKSAQALLATDVEKRKQQNSIKPGRTHNSTKNGKTDTGTGSSAREIGTSALPNRFMNTSTTRDSGVGVTPSRGDADRSNNNDFKFVPEMSYTDQLLLQKLRKMREKDGWGDVSEVEVPTDIPDKSEIELMRKRVEMDVPKETERGSMGPVSLNAILRARLTK